MKSYMGNISRNFDNFSFKIFLLLRYLVCLMDSISVRSSDRVLSPERELCVSLHFVIMLLIVLLAKRQ